MKKNNINVPKNVYIKHNKLVVTKKGQKLRRMKNIIEDDVLDTTTTIVTAKMNFNA